ncbi:MAG: DUF2993 domain-containing protein [Leptolyngbyaceae cyanobacterium bins.302]|nr:DUF2993 domain-containing protein [Leptolyngbyaceae cyanobacterium bins.302]
MEIFILILSSLISVLSPANLVADKVLEGAVRSQFKQVEQLQVRVDNAPVHNVAAGKIDRLRIAGRGFYPLEGIRIDTLELETDPINISVADLKKRRYALQSPLGVGVRVVIREADVLQALRSPIVTARIQQLLRGLNRTKQNLPESGSSDTPQTLAQDGLRETIDTIRQTVQEYRIVNPRVEFLENRRIQIQADVEEVKTGETLKLAIETGLEILEGRQIQFLSPSLSVNGQPFPAELVRGFAENIAKDLNLERLEKLLQVRARVFRVRFTDNSLEIAAFVGLPAGFRI